MSTGWIPFKQEEQLLNLLLPLDVTLGNESNPDGCFLAVAFFHPPKEDFFFLMKAAHSLNVRWC